MVLTETGIREGMTIGASLFLIAIGAILRFAVEDAIPGVDLTTVGLILLIIGFVGLAIGLFMNFTGGRRGPVEREPRYPADRGY